MVRFFISIDGILFNFISTLYDLLIAISRTSILTQGDIASFATRIEILLGIFMLFKISFSLITYIVNPDDFSDKSKGFGKLIQNTVVSLVLLVITPYIFQMAFSLQAKILDDNTLAKLLLGEKIMSEDTGDDESTGNVMILDTAGNRMAFYVMLPFFTPRTSLEGLDVCTNIYSKGEFDADCYDALNSLAGSTGGSNDSDSGENQYIKNYKYGIENESLGLTFRSSTALLTTGEGDSEQFLIDYKYILSTATAVIVCLLLITFCIDVGVRSVKLAFLQLIYPIPVISYMDPKSGNDGMFTKWYKMCLSTFLSLFIRLLALYFGIYIISKVGTMGMYDIINGSQITNGWVKIFVIIGILMFVKQMPKILENLGIKIDGDGKFNLNPLKRLEDGALGGKVLSRAPKAAAGAALGLGVGAVGAATGAGIGKGITGMFSGASGALKGKKLGEIHKGQVDANQRMREARANGSTFFGRVGTKIGGLTGSGGANARLQSEDKKLENKLKNYEEAHKSFDDLKSKLVGNIKGGKAPDFIAKKYNSMRADVEAKKALKDSLSRDMFRTDADFESAVNVASNDLINAENDLAKYEKKDAVEQFYEMYRNGSIQYKDSTGNVQVHKATIKEKEALEKVKNEFDQFDQIAAQHGVNVSTYSNADAFDTNNVNEIARVNRDRQKIRDEREKAAADKSALGK